MSAVQDKILLATLAHVPFDGWSRAALKHGALDSGLGRDLGLGAFPGGMVEVAAYCSAYFDRRMVEELERRKIGEMKVRDRVTVAVRARLEELAPYREACRRLMSFLALPPNAGLCASCTWKTVNAMWYAAGDTATDFNFYTKRALLASVYASTTLYWLGDDSEGFADTWGFLDRRIAGVMKIPKIKARVAETLARIPSPFGIWRALSGGQRGPKPSAR